MDIISASVNLFHGVDRPTAAVRDPTREQDWVVSGLISAFHSAKPSPVPTAEEVHDELDGGDPPQLPSDIPSVHAVATHDDDARGGISTTEETSREHDDVSGHVDGAPIIPDSSASADSFLPPSSLRGTAEDSDSDSDDDLIILVNYEDHELPPSRPGEGCSPYEIWNSMRSGAKPVVSQEKWSEYRKITDREEKLRREIGLLKRNISFFEKNCRPTPKQPIGRPIPVECNFTERLPSAETKAMPLPWLHSDVIIQIELQDIDLATFTNGAPEKAADHKDLKREGGEGIASGTATKMEKKRKRDHKVDRYR